jgi:fumarylacetoacetase
MTHRVSWVPGSDGPFGVQTLPYGVADLGGRARIVIRIGAHALDLGPAAHALDLAPDLLPLVEATSLNPLMAAGPAAWARVRAAATDWLVDDTLRERVQPHLAPLAGLRMLLAFDVADYVDFYSSRHHAENLGALFRPGQPPLTPNWTHLPIGYHGRSGTVVVSGTPIVRPSGQRRPPESDAPVFGPSVRLDIEAEVGFVVGVPSPLGRPVPVAEFADHVFGVVLVNDWSARDLQAWEYVPLGPFLGKSFATSVSAWVTPLAALEPARVAAPVREVPLLGYLEDSATPWGLDLELEVELNGTVVSRPPFAQMYWTAAQQLAHLTVNGASTRTGDLFASGTVSGPEPDQCGSLIELAWNGQRPLALPGGSSRSFLEDGDEVVLRATAPGPDGSRVGLGDVAGRILPALG